jgi:hypothetical protein
VVLAGILSTFVAIYERLGEISRKLDNNWCHHIPLWKMVKVRYGCKG